MPIELHRLYVQKEIDLRSQLSYGQKVVVNRTNSESNDDAPAWKMTTKEAQELLASRSNVKSVTKEDGTIQYYSISPGPLEGKLTEEVFPDGRIKYYIYSMYTYKLADVEEVFPDGSSKIYAYVYDDMNAGKLTDEEEVLPDGRIKVYVHVHDDMNPGELTDVEEVLPDQVNETTPKNDDDTPALKLVTKEDGTEQYYIVGSPEHPNELLAEEHFLDGKIKKYIYDETTDELIGTEEILPNRIIKKTDLRPNPENLAHTDEFYPNGQIIKYTYKKDTKTLVSTEEIYPDKSIVKKTFYHPDTFPDQNLLDNIQKFNGIKISSNSIITKVETTSPDGTITEGIILDEIDDTPKVISKTSPNGVTQKYGLNLTGGANVTEKIYPDGTVRKYSYCSARLYPDKKLVQGFNIPYNGTITTIEEKQADGTIIESVLISSLEDDTPLIVSITTSDGAVTKYDTKGHVTEELTPDQIKREYTYDEKGKQFLSKETFKDGAYKIYSYIDGKQVVIQEKTSNGELIEFSPEENCKITYKDKKKNIIIKREILNEDNREYTLITKMDGLKNILQYILTETRYITQSMVK